MQAAIAVADRDVDFATTVLATMRQLGVVGLPNNYAIFYEALSGSNHALSVEVVALGNRPSQDALDRIGRKFFAHAHGGGIAGTARETTELESANSKLEEYKRLADTDSLTQLWNRRGFDTEIARIYNSGCGIPSSALILIDIDRFKDINDRFGHPVGDRIIQSIAGIFRSSVREGVFVARTGGEEFALVVEGATEDATFAIANRLRLLIEQTPFTNEQGNGGYGPITVSMGLCMASEADSADDLYSKSDRALYRSKVTGRNRVTRYSGLPERAAKNWLVYKKD